MFYEFFTVLLQCRDYYNEVKNVEVYFKIIIRYPIFQKGDKANKNIFQ